MQKRIAIITYSRAYNYGSALQTFALNFYLRKQGYDVKTVDYTTKQQEKLYRIFEPYRGILSMLRNVHSLVNIFKLLKHKKSFDRFILENVPMTQKITDDEQIHRLNREFDYFICGSDQIWNVQCDDFTSNYMLSFVEDKKKCIAYAPSLGAGVNNIKTIEFINTYVSGFKSLSSRETNSRSIIEKAACQFVTNVLDPVFLVSVDDWSKMASNPVIKGDYVLGYFIGDVAGMRDFAALMQKKMRMPVVVIYKNLRDLKYKFKNHYEVGPAEFVSLVKHSKCIVTNSFHAVSFSLIFKKNFWVFVEKTGDSRIIGILEKVNLVRRIVNISSSKVVDMTDDIIYDAIDMTPLTASIEESKKFLIDSVS
jgi:Polysaccharide pyruvyl transferase.